MRVSVRGFDWDEDNESHAQGHGVSVDEIESIIANDTRRTVYKKHPRREGRLFAYGSTVGGRCLTVIFDFDQATRMARPVTAWDMKPGERTKYVR